MLRPKSVDVHENHVGAIDRQKGVETKREITQSMGFVSVERTASNHGIEILNVHRLCVSAHCSRCTRTRA